MEDTFEIPITYKGEEQLFTARLIALGYVHKIQVDVHGVAVIFEADEEGLYRAIIDPATVKDQHIDIGLLEEITRTIQSVRE
jgi:hypothetical protein